MISLIKSQSRPNLKVHHSSVCQNQGEELLIFLHFSQSNLELISPTSAILICRGINKVVAIFFLAFHQFLLSPNESLMAWQDVRFYDEVVV